VSNNNSNDQYIDCGNGMLFPRRAECMPATPVGTRRNSANTDTKRFAATKKRALNPDTPVSELQILASATNCHVRKCVALNPARLNFCSKHWRWMMRQLYAKQSRPGLM